MQSLYAAYGDISVCLRVSNTHHSARIDCRLRGNLNVLNPTCGFRDWNSILAQTFEMELYGLTDLRFRFFNRYTRRYTPRQIRNVG
jgi:hypothetical protein